MIDALGRTIKTVDRLTSSESEVPQVVMRYTYDIRGNLLQVEDALSTDLNPRYPFLHTYDLANRPLKTTHLDAGTKTVVYDCMGKPVEMRDSKGSLVLNAYDNLNRPTHVWAMDDSTATGVTLRQYIQYGDELGGSPEDNNLKGKPYKHYDEAGLTEFIGYDFKGNLLAKKRKAIKDEEILTAFNGFTGTWDVKTYRVDWGTSTDSILEIAEYRTDMAYDALNRVTQMTYPLDVNGGRKVLLPAYNKGGAMESVTLKETPLSDPMVSVERIVYNAKGQRILIAYGNGIMTRYRYDSVNFRLTRMKSEKYDNSTDPLIYEPDGGIKQNLAYEYDLAGNILNITDSTQDCGIEAADSLERVFTYDPLYRLLTATGRERDTMLPPDWDETDYSQDQNATRGYKQFYGYDKMGNILQLQHQDLKTGAGSFTRIFNPNEDGEAITRYGDNNLLNKIKIGSNNYNFVYDANGNQISSDNGNSRHMEYDYADKLKSFRVQPSISEPSQYVHYLYDAGGNRVKKLIRIQGGKFISTTYIDRAFEYTRDNYTGIPELEVGEFFIGDGRQNILHVMDGNSRMASVRLGESLGDTSPPNKYNLEDHLGSSSIVLNEDGSWISREEYYPFGETSFGSYAKKRYRFCGKEKDGESGLYYYGMRYYSAWTCRFISVDPMASKYTFYTPYQYAGNKPINFIDLDGAEEALPDQKKKANQIISNFEQNDKTISVFKGISKEILVSDLKKSINNPAQINIPTDNGYYCGMHVVSYLNAFQDPINYVQSVLELYQKGKTKINGQPITASESLKDANPPSNYEPSAFIHGGAIRENNNWCDYNTTNKMWPSTSGGTMEKWLNNYLGLNVYKFSFGYEFVSDGITDAGVTILENHLSKGLQAVLLVDSDQFERGEGDGAFYGDHFVVLSGNMDLSKEGSVTFNYYDSHVNNKLTTKTMNIQSFKDMINKVMMVEKNVKK